MAVPASVIETKPPQKPDLRITPEAVKPLSGLASQYTAAFEILTQNRKILKQKSQPFENDQRLKSVPQEKKSEITQYLASTDAEISQAIEAMQQFEQAVTQGTASQDSAGEYTGEYKIISDQEIIGPDGKPYKPETTGNVTHFYGWALRGLKRIITETGGNNDPQLQKIHDNATEALDGIRSNIRINIGNEQITIYEWEKQITEETLIQWRELTGRPSGNQKDCEKDLKSNKFLKYIAETKAEETLIQNEKTSGNEVSYNLVYTKEQANTTVSQNEETMAKPERVRIQEETFETAKQLLSAWDQNDNLVNNDEKPEIEIEGRKPVPERGRLAMLLDAYGATIIDEAKLSLTAEIHLLLQRLQINPDINPELAGKVSELRKNDPIMQDIDKTVLTRISSMAGVEIPDGSIRRGNQLTDVLLAYTIKQSGLELERDPNSGYAVLPKEAREDIMRFMEKGLMNRNDENLIKYLLTSDTSEQILSNLYGFDINLLNDLKNAPAIIAKRLTGKVHDEWSQEKLNELDPEARKNAIKQKETTEKVLENDISVSWQRFTDKSNKGHGYMKMMGLMALICMPQINELLKTGVEEERASPGGMH